MDLNETIKGIILGYKIKGKKLYQTSMNKNYTSKDMKYNHAIEGIELSTHLVSEVK
jgi:hypothetical protein